MDPLATPWCSALVTWPECTATWLCWLLDAWTLADCLLLPAGIGCLPAGIWIAGYCCCWLAVVWLPACLLDCCLLLLAGLLPGLADHACTDPSSCWIPSATPTLRPLDSNPLLPNDPPGHFAEIPALACAKSSRPQTWLRPCSPRPRLAWPACCPSRQPLVPTGNAFSRLALITLRLRQRKTPRSRPVHAYRPPVHA
jgi:hypothetical protein